MTSDLRAAFALDAIERDVQFVGRLISSLDAPGPKKVAGIIVPTIVPYLALFVHESARKVQIFKPGAVSPLSEDVASVVAKSRHSLKLFEDTKQSVEDQLSYVDDVLVPAHKKRFLGNTWLPIARPLENDVGIYRYEKRPISTTHGISLSMGLEINEVLAGAGRRVMDVAAAQGKYFAHLGARIEPGGESFISQLIPRKVDYKDRKSWKIYQQVFPGFNPAVTSLLLNHACAITFVKDVVYLDRASSSRQTILKICYLTLYQVVRSLQIVLRGEQYDVSGWEWAGSTLDVLECATFADVLPESSRLLRNTLMHYEPDTRLDVEAMDLDQPFYGLTDQCLAMSLDEFESSLLRALTRMQSIFETQLVGLSG